MWVSHFLPSSAHSPVGDRRETTIIQLWRKRKAINVDVPKLNHWRQKIIKNLNKEDLWLLTTMRLGKPPPRPLISGLACYPQCILSGIPVSFSV